jgi:hypothetical protein
LQKYFSKILIKRCQKKYEKGLFLKKAAVKFYGGLQKIWFADLRILNQYEQIFFIHFRSRHVYRGGIHVLQKG